MSSNEVKPGKNCRLCSKQLDHHVLGSDFTCRTCQYECHRVEPLLREMAALHMKQQRENAQAIKALKDEISELKNNLSNRQQKASTTLKGLRDAMSELSSEVSYLKQIKTKVEGDDRFKKIEKEIEDVKTEVKNLDQEVANVYADQENDSRWEDNEIDKAEVRQTVDGMVDFTRRLKEAFVALAGPEEKKVQQMEAQREKDAQELKDGMREMQGFMRQMQQAFSMLPVLAASTPAQTQQIHTPTQSQASTTMQTTVPAKAVTTSAVKKK
ncbi:hypothetical protein sr15926 [Sporisorium reilianum SRZ2]|uniref:Uncharacterized protein n=1 Tax=Sporisorium reilianum (strain SRZ2) TaxID=999809 RepID=E6ZQF6_SPORE|nr:hypothetical protein sr15926 [Sporisorium reilianum SRZ2]